MDNLSPINDNIFIGRPGIDSFQEQGEEREGRGPIHLVDKGGIK